MRTTPTAEVLELIGERVMLNKELKSEERKNEKLERKLRKVKNKIQLIQTYTDDERILAQCNLILKELDDEE